MNRLRDVRFIGISSEKRRNTLKKKHFIKPSPGGEKENSKETVVDNCNSMSCCIHDLDMKCILVLDLRVLAKY